MSNQFTGSGNLGQTPALKTVSVKGKERDVVNFSVYFDRNRVQDDGSYADEGGFWLPVTAWEHLAKSVVRVCEKGLRVQVTGELRLESWEDEHGDERTQLRLTANQISIDPICLESINMRRREKQVHMPTNDDQDYPEYAVDPGL